MAPLLRALAASKFDFQYMHVNSVPGDLKLSSGFWGAHTQAKDL